MNIEKEILKKYNMTYGILTLAEWDLQNIGIDPKLLPESVKVKTRWGNFGEYKIYCFDVK